MEWERNNERSSLKVTPAWRRRGSRDDEDCSPWFPSARALAAATAGGSGWQDLVSGGQAKTREEEELGLHIFVFLFFNLCPAD